MTANSLECVQVYTHEKTHVPTDLTPGGAVGWEEGAGEGRDKSDAARPAAPDVEPMM